MSERVRALEDFKEAVENFLEKLENDTPKIFKYGSLASYMGNRPSEKEIKERLDELWSGFKIVSASLNLNRDMWTIVYIKTETDSLETGIPTFCDYISLELPSVGAQASPIRWR